MGCNNKPGKQYVKTGFCGKHQPKTKLTVKKSDLQINHPWDPQRLDKITRKFSEKYNPLTFAIEPRSEAIGEDKAIATDVITVEEDGETIAYLKVSYMTEELFNKVMPTKWHYLSNYKGRHGLYDYDGNERVPLEATPERIAKLNQGYMQPWEEEHVDAEVTKTKNYHRFPYVAYVKVAEAKRGTGVSDKMYELATDIYGGISSSNIQTQAASKMWERLSENIDYVEWGEEGEQRQGIIKNPTLFESLFYAKSAEPTNAKSVKRFDF